MRSSGRPSRTGSSSSPASPPSLPPEGEAALPGRLPRAFYARPAVRVARDLLGCSVSQFDADSGLVRRARIVETEAYAGPHDLACHASRGLTPRTSVMFGPPGHAYLYFIYGMHWCFNVVVEREGFPAAVLVRAGVPLEACDGHLSGPGVFARALHLDRRHNGVDLCGESLWIGPREGVKPRIVSAERINVDYAGAWARRRWRYAIDQEPAVSRPRPFKLSAAKRRSV